MNTASSSSRCGFVALIGAPNAGKSTLLNTLVGTKVSIVSRKVQTTRSLVRGIVLEGMTQMIFVDTPGLFEPKRRLDRAMVHAAWRGAEEADVIAWLVDARKGIQEELQTILEKLRLISTPKILLLNKIDVMDPPKLLELTATLNQELAFEKTFMISALKGRGLDDFRRGLVPFMHEGPWLYPEDQITDAPLRSLAAEVTREKIFERLHEELPYHTTVETEEWQHMRDGSIRIHQTIYVTRESHKKIIIGEKGKMLKSIGQAARREIAEAAEAPVHLFLFVKVREHWGEDPHRYRAMGLEFPT